LLCPFPRLSLKDLDLFFFSDWIKEDEVIAGLLGGMSFSLPNSVPGIGDRPSSQLSLLRGESIEPQAPFSRAHLFFMNPRIFFLEMKFSHPEAQSRFSFSLLGPGSAGARGPFLFPPPLSYERRRGADFVRLIVPTSLFSPLPIPRSGSAAGFLPLFLSPWSEREDDHLGRVSRGGGLILFSFPKYGVGIVASPPSSQDPGAGAARMEFTTGSPFEPLARRHYAAFSSLTA